jgi:hypothetical protein
VAEAQGVNSERGDKQGEGRDGKGCRLRFAHCGRLLSMKAKPDCAIGWDGPARTTFKKRGVSAMF